MIRIILEERKGFSESRDSFEKPFHVLRSHLCRLHYLSTTHFTIL